MTTNEVKSEMSISSSSCADQSDFGSRRSSYRFTQQQVSLLRRVFEKYGAYPGGAVYNELAKHFGISRKKLYDWFAHERRRVNNKKHMKVCSVAVVDDTNHTSLNHEQASDLETVDSLVSPCHWLSAEQIKDFFSHLNGRIEKSVQVPYHEVRQELREMREEMADLRSRVGQCSAQVAEITSNTPPQPPRVCIVKQQQTITWMPASRQQLLQFNHHHPQVTSPNEWYLA